MIYVAAIIMVNVFVVVVSFWLVIYTYRKCWILPICKKDKIFYGLKLKKCLIFFLYNFIAMYVNFRLFTDPDISVQLFKHTDLTFLRYVERAVTLLYLGLKTLDVCKYCPSNYDKLNDK